jgi:polyisoprenoid-binding protein YceI
MRIRKQLSTVGIALVLLVTNVLAEAVRYTPDRWHTRIYFTISHMGLSDFQGRFIDYNFDFMFDEDNFSNSRIEVTVPISGIDTFSSELNEKMPREKFFDVENFPVAHFVSTRITTIDQQHAMMIGDLTIRGVTREVTFEVIYNNKVMHPYFKLNNIGLTATAEIDSREFGVNTLPEWMLASKVGLRIEMEAFEGEKIPYYSE